MNKKLHFLLFCLLIIFILCSCKDKLLEIFVLEPFGNQLEPFGNQIVIHPDTAELNPRETTFSILTYDSDLGSGVTQASTCSDDSSWSNDDKTCRDYSMEGANCEDIGSDGRLAFDACKVACDNCNTYTEVKRRLPSPVEEVDEPSYAQFEGSMSSGDIGSDIGGPDYREIIGKLDDLSGKIDLIEVSSGSSEDDDGTCVKKATTSVPADAEACAAVKELSTPNACEAVMTTADPPVSACTYNPAITGGDSDDGDGSCSGCVGITCEDESVECTGEGASKIQTAPLTCLDSVRESEYQDICCETPTTATTATTTTTTVPADSGQSGVGELCSQPTDDALTGYSLGEGLTFSTTKFNIPNLACDTKSGYGTLEDGDGKQIPAKATACSESGTAYTLECCYKTSFCRENEKDIYDVHCMPFFFTDKEFEKGDDGKENIPPGQDFDTCCENNVWGRVSVMIVIVLYFLYKTVSEWDDNDRETHTLWRVGGIFILAAWIFTNIIPYTIYYLRKFLDVEKEKSDIGSWWETAFYFFIVVPTSAFFLYKYNNKY